MATTEREFQDALAAVLDDPGDWLEVDRVRTFEEVGMLTRDKGLVVQLRDGSEFQITIVQLRGE